MADETPGAKTGSASASNVPAANAEAENIARTNSRQSTGFADRARIRPGVSGLLHMVNTKFISNLRPVELGD
jgi:hypothetical protein